MTMISEISDFSRFRTASEFASFLGLVPGENSSGEKTQRTSITKSGNSQCRKTLMEVLQADKLDIAYARVPFDGTWSYATKNGKSVLSVDLDENEEKLKEFLYGE